MNGKLKVFFQDLIQETTTKFPNQIVTVILFGSATTGEWIRGKSDIDCIVLIKDRKKRKEVEQYLHQTLLRLDTKYDLKLSDTCTSYKKTQNHALNLLLRLEHFGMFGRPFYVISEEQIDLNTAKIRDDFKTYVGTHVLVSVNLFLHRIQSTGKILYGKDVIKEFPENTPLIEKFKASLNALLLLTFGFAITPLDSKSALQHAVKANFWACDNVLFALEKPLSNTESEIIALEKIFPTFMKNRDVMHLYTSLRYKKLRNLPNLKKRFVFKYLIKSTGLIFKLYFLTIRKLFMSVW